MLKGKATDPGGNGNSYTIVCSDPVSIDAKGNGSFYLGVVYGLTLSLSIISQLW